VTDDSRVPLDAYIDETRAELARADAKASMLAALGGASLAVLAAGPLLTGDTAGHWAVRAGALLLVLALVVLLSVVRPKTTGAPFARITADPTRWKPERTRERLVALAAVTDKKFRRVRVAVDLLICAALVIGVGLAWIGAAS
jgi:putative intracellular protease/amidase